MLPNRWKFCMTLECQTLFTNYQYKHFWFKSLSKTYFSINERLAPVSKQYKNDSTRWDNVSLVVVTLDTAVAGGFSWAGVTVTTFQWYAL